MSSRGTSDNRGRSAGGLLLRVARGAVLGAALGAAALGSSGCRVSPDLLVVLDPYTDAVMRERGQPPEAIRAELRGIARIRVEVVSPGERGGEELRALLARLSPRGVYLSPLLASTGLAIASESPDTLFFLDGPLPAGTAVRGSNLRVLVHDLAAAYVEAATALRAMLSLPELPSRLGLGVSETRGAAVAVVGANPDKSARRELQLFREALSGGEAGVGAEYRELDSLEDRAKARRSLERLREEGIGIFLLRTSTLTGFCLEVLQKEGGLAIAESEAGIEAYAEVLLLTFERDLVGALLAMAGALAGEAVAEATAEAQPLRVPVRLRWWGVSPKESQTHE